MATANQAANCVTIRGDGAEIRQIHVGSRAMMMPPETWRRGLTNRVVRTTHRGDHWSEDVSLRQRLVELAGYELGAELYEQAKDCDVVTIADEYRY